MSILPDARLYINGILRDAEDSRTFDVISPWTGSAVGVAADAAAKDVDEAIAAARQAFDTTDWSINGEKRLVLVKRLRNLFEANRQRVQRPCPA